MADYTPDLGNYTELKPFRFWCQKVLPLVYDDSLSYYELLCKVVDYLNKTMEDVDTLHDDVVNLHAAYVQLQDYVNTYFDNLDVQEEINNKLDDMAEDGSLSTLISPFIPDIVTNWLDDHVQPTSPVVDNTLSISGAAADSKATGDAITNLRALAVKNARIYSGSDANAIADSAWYFCDGASVSHCPDNTHAFYILTLPIGANTTLMQIAFNWTTGMYSYRRRLYDLTWENWRESIPIEVVKNYGVSSETSCNSFTENGWYFCDGTTVGDLPNNTNAFYLLNLTLASGYSTRLQYAINWTTGLSFFRRCTNSVWTSWVSNTPFEVVKNYAVFSGSSANDIDKNGWFFCDGSTVSDCPNNTLSFYILNLMIQEGGTTRLQFAINWTTGEYYYRRRNYSGSWTDWIDPVPFNTMHNYSIYSGNDANDLDQNGWYFCDGSTVAHCPSNTLAFYILNLMIQEGGTTRLQFAINWTTGLYSFRRRNFDGSWTNWTGENQLSIGTKYVAFGDSVYWGAIWTDTESYQCDLKYQIPTRIAKAIGFFENFINESVGGTGYCNPGNTTTITQKVLNYDFTDVEIVTLAGGVNDKPEYSLGTAASSVAGDGTICGAIKSIINYMATNYPRTQIVFIQPTPSGHLQDAWNGTLGGGWSLNDFIDEVGAICEAEHVTFIDYKDSVYCKQWDTFSGGTGGGESANYSHFKIDTDSARFGDYVAGKVAAHFHGNH